MGKLGERVLFAPDAREACPVGCAGEAMEIGYEGFAKPGSSTPLDLSEQQETALKALQAFARHVGSEVWEAQQGTAEKSRLAIQGLFASAQVVSSGLPPCPYAPPGASISVQFKPPDNEMVLQCNHAGTRHCWEELGTKPYTC